MDALPVVVALDVAEQIPPCLLAGRPASLEVGELADKARTLERMTSVGRTLRDTHGADALVMGCAGMAQFRAPLEETLGIPVFEPAQGATAMAGVSAVE